MLLCTLSHMHSQKKEEEEEEKPIGLKGTFVCFSTGSGLASISLGVGIQARDAIGVGLSQLLLELREEGLVLLVQPLRLLPKPLVLLHDVAVPQVVITTCFPAKKKMAQFCCLFLSLFLLISVEASEYTRPPPGRVLVTKHTENDSYPQQVHISAVGSEYMRITWITDDNHVPSIVDYGHTPGVYDTSATGDHTKYRYFFYTSGIIHNVKIGPLSPDTVYYYRCGRVGDEYGFKTPPASLPIEFAIAGDLGQTEWTASTLSHINKSNYDILLIPGDLSYADTQQPLWDSFGRFVEPYASSRPWMVTQGNHEQEFIFDWFHPFAAYNHRWLMPYQESGSTSNLYYSFDAAGGAIHVVMLGSYTDFDSDSDQYKWLKQDLRKVDRKRTPWLFVLLHAPWYNTNSAHQGEGESMRKDMEELLYEAGVDAVFVGHVHAYERFTRVYDNAADARGPVHITIGDGGNREGLALDFEENHKSAPFSLFREASFGHGRLKVLNRTHAHWSWHRNNDSCSVVADEVWLQSLSSHISTKHSSTKDEL